MQVRVQRRRSAVVLPQHQHRVTLPTDHFAKYRKIAADGHVLELEVGMLRFNCTSMKRLRIIPSVVLARERNFEVVLATLDGDEQFALKRVNHNFTEPVVSKRARAHVVLSCGDFLFHLFRRFCR